MNAKLRKKAKNNFEKDFFKLMSNVVFGNTMENVNHRKKRHYLVSEPNYHNTSFFTENILAIEMRKTLILMNNPVYLDLIKFR